MMENMSTINRGIRRSERINPRPSTAQWHQHTPPTSPNRNNADSEHHAESANRQAQNEAESANRQAQSEYDAESANRQAQNEAERANRQAQVVNNDHGSGNNIQDRLSRLESMVLNLTSSLNDYLGRTGESTTPVNRRLNLTSPSPIALEGSLAHNTSIPSEYQKPTEKSHKESYSNPNTITKLKRDLSNIGQWYLSIQDYFQFEMWPFDHMEGTYKYVESQNRAFAIVNTSLPTLMRRETRAFKTANEILTHVRKHLTDSNPYMIENMRSKLYTFSWVNIQEAEDQVSQIIIDLEATGHVVNDSEKITALLRMPPDHMLNVTSDIKSSMELSQRPWNFTDVLNRLKRIEPRSHKNKSRPNTKRDQIKRNAELIMTTSERPKCTYCRKTGHTESKCYFKKKKESENINPTEVICLTSPSTLDSHEVLLDSGATVHMVCDLEYFVDLEKLQSPMTVRGIFGDEKTINYTGSVIFRSSKTSHSLRLTNVCYCPDSSSNVFSLSQARKDGIWIKSLPKEDTLILYHTKGNVTLTTATYRNNNPILDGNLIRAPEQLTIPNDELIYEATISKPECLFSMSAELSDKEFVDKKNLTKLPVKESSFQEYNEEYKRSKIKKQITSADCLKQEYLSDEDIITDLKEVFKQEHLPGEQKSSVKESC